MIPQKYVKNILVINLGGVGDCLLATPALLNLRLFYPNARISALTMSRSREILEETSLTDEVISIQSFKDLRKIWVVLMDLRNRKIDVAVNMRTIASFWGAIKMALLFFLIGPRVKVGRDTDERGFFLDIKLPESLHGTKHDIDYNNDLMNLLGAPIVFKRPEIKLREEDIAYADSIMKECGIISSDVVVGMAPWAPYMAKRWPLGNFIKTARALAEHGYKVMAMGSEDENEVMYAFGNTGDTRIISLIGKTNIRQVEALINRCSLFITNDTGPMHIAAILGTPLVAIFGPGYLVRYDPRNISDKAVVLYKKADCAPCTRENCGSLKCLKSISPEEVVNTALELLDRYKNKR